MSEKKHEPGCCFDLDHEGACKPRVRLPVASPQATRPLDDLVAQITPENVHKEQPSEEPTPQAERPNEQIWASIIRVAESRREHGECRLSKRACQKLLSERLRAVAPVETRLTAEQFAQQTLGWLTTEPKRNTVTMAGALKLAEALRDKSEAELRQKLGEVRTSRQKWITEWNAKGIQLNAAERENAGLREEIERLRREADIAVQLHVRAESELRAKLAEPDKNAWEAESNLWRERAEAAEAEVAALRERERSGIKLWVQNKLDKLWIIVRTPNGSQFALEMKEGSMEHGILTEALSAAPETK